LYGIKTIPQLVVLDKYGSIITTNGRIEICNEREEVFKKWLDKNN
jgi:hypothetical protein